MFAGTSCEAAIIAVISVPRKGAAHTACFPALASFEVKFGAVFAVVGVARAPFAFGTCPTLITVDALAPIGPCRLNSRLIQRASVLAGLDVTFEKPLKGAFVAKNALQSAGALAFLGANSDALANLSVENGIILAVMLIKVALVALNATPIRLEAARHGNSSKRVLAVASDFVSKSAMCTVRVLDNTDVTFLSTPG